MKVLGVVSVSAAFPVAVTQLYPKEGALPLPGDLNLPARLTYEADGKERTAEMFIPVTLEMTSNEFVFNTLYDFRIEAEEDMRLVKFEVDIAPARQAVCGDEPDMAPQWGKLYASTASIPKGGALFIQYDTPIVSCEV